MDAAGLRHHIGKIREVPLYHVIMPLLNVGCWLERLNYELIRQGYRNVPA